MPFLFQTRDGAGGRGHGVLGQAGSDVRNGQRAHESVQAEQCLDLLFIQRPILVFVVFAESLFAFYFVGFVFEEFVFGDLVVLVLVAGFEVILDFFVHLFSFRPLFLSLGFLFLGLFFGFFVVSVVLRINRKGEDSEEGDDGECGE